MKMASALCLVTNEKLQYDPHFNNYILFYEYFHGDTGRGLGASHQTGWTGLIANLLQPRSKQNIKATTHDKVSFQTEANLTHEVI